MPRPARPPTAAGTRMPTRAHHLGLRERLIRKNPATSITAGASPESYCSATCGWPRLVNQGDTSGASWLIHHSLLGKPLVSGSQYWSRKNRWAVREMENGTVAQARFLAAVSRSFSELVSGPSRGRCAVRLA